jgi:hypothetical protein
VRILLALYGRCAYSCGFALTLFFPRWHYGTTHTKGEGEGQRRESFMRCELVAVLCLPLVLTGCTMTPTAAPTASAGVKIAGVVHGGQQPVVGAKVFLFAANTTGYGGNGIVASASNASISLLTSAANTVQDTNSADATYQDYYTTTDGTGSFSITGDYSCASGQQVYLYAAGGNPTYPAGSANAAIGLLAGLGACPSAGNFGSATPYVVVNEVSTIATAYGFAGFATNAVHVGSSGTALALVGIANAFANAANLETLATGVALATTPAGNGTVPQATINTLADILAACVNTNAPSSGACTTLFANAMSAGSTGATAGDTATAAINIAHNPGANIAALYGLVTANPPFASPLNAQPNDFTVGLNFTGGGLGGPTSIAIDASGNAWAANYNNNALSEFSSTGAALSPSVGGSYGLGGFSGGGLGDSGSLAIDGSGEIWITNAYNEVSEFSNAGLLLSPYCGRGCGGYTGGGLGFPESIAIDGSGNAWTANSNSSVSKFSNSGVALSPSTGYTGGGLDGSAAIAVDSSRAVWIASGLYNAGRISKLSDSGVALSPSTGYTGGGMDTPSSLAIDGSGNVWVGNSGNGISEFSNAGATLSPPSGYAGGGFNEPKSIAIDGSGNVWVANQISGTVSETDSTVSELIGVAAPVITPICAGLPAVPTVDGSSKLGTRP